MDLTLLLGFILTSVVFIAMPGPNILVIVATSVQSGRQRGLQTVAGTSLAMIVQLLVAGLATSGVLVLLNVGLRWLKWAGVAYLAVLGVRALLRCWQHQDSPGATGLGSFQRGFWVSLTNPKTILFFSAFLPQFVSPAGNYVAQLATLSLLFWLLAVLIDSSYAILAGRMRWLWTSRTGQRTLNGISGSIYVAASTLLANTNRA